MQSTHLNEHRSNQGAQSEGEFLGMTGNSGWYLLGSVGATLLMITFLWGTFGVSLLLCLALGLVLCGSSIAYVFTLKNNRPKHYDMDFFESALVEAGVIGLQFAPRKRRFDNPFDREEVPGAVDVSSDNHISNPALAKKVTTVSHGKATPADVAPTKETGNHSRHEPVTDRIEDRSDHEELSETLAATEEMLEDALAEGGEA